MNWREWSHQELCKFAKTISSEFYFDADWSALFSVKREICGISSCGQHESVQITVLIRSVIHMQQNKDNEALNMFRTSSWWLTARPLLAYKQEVLIESSVFLNDPNDWEWEDFWAKSWTHINKLSKKVSLLGFFALHLLTQCYVSHWAHSNSRAGECSADRFNNRSLHQNRRSFCGQEVKKPPIELILV